MIIYSNTGHQLRRVLCCAGANSDVSPDLHHQSMDPLTSHNPLTQVKRIVPYYWQVRYLANQLESMLIYGIYPMPRHITTSCSSCTILNPCAARTRHLPTMREQQHPHFTTHPARGFLTPLAAKLPSTSPRSAGFDRGSRLLKLRSRHHTPGAHGNRVMAAGRQLHCPRSSL